MKPNILLAIAAALSSVIAVPVQAQQSPTARAAAQPQRVEVPSGGFTFSFAEIDRNGDNSISVEEWNAFVAGLQARTAQGDATPRQGGSAAGGGTRPPEARPQSQPQR